MRGSKSVFETDPACRRRARDRCRVDAYPLKCRAARILDRLATDRARVEKHRPNFAKRIVRAEQNRLAGVGMAVDLRRREIDNRRLVTAIAELIRDDIAIAAMLFAIDRDIETFHADVYAREGLAQVAERIGLIRAATENERAEQESNHIDASEHDVRPKQFSDHLRESCRDAVIFDERE